MLMEMSLERLNFHKTTIYNIGNECQVSGWNGYGMCVAVCGHSSFFLSVTLRKKKLNPLAQHFHKMFKITHRLSSGANLGIYTKYRCEQCVWYLCAMLAHVYKKRYKLFYNQIKRSNTQQNIETNYLFSIFSAIISVLCVCVYLECCLPFSVL